jgi:quercetin dioxygenase-like cupin family protein
LKKTSKLFFNSFFGNRQRDNRRKIGRKIGRTKMKITSYKTAELKKNPHGVTINKLHDNEHAQVMHIELKPGESLKTHTTPVDVFFYVLEGEGIVEIGDEQETVTKDMLIDSPAGIPHRIMNESDSTFRVLVTKTPKPTEVTKFK